MDYEQKCIICDEVITNPICPECLEKEVIQWISEEKPSLIPFIQKFYNLVDVFSYENTSCVICKKNMNMCPHCYCLEIYSWLNTLGYEELSKKFLSRFDFELKWMICK